MARIDRRSRTRTAPRPGADQPVRGRATGRRPEATAELDVPASVLAPRALLAGFVTTLVATAAGAMIEAGWLEATDPAHVSASANARDLGRALGLGLLVGALSGAVAGMLSAWGAMAFRRQLLGSRTRARLMAMGLAVAVWAALVALVLHVLGVDGLGWSAWGMALVPLAITLVLTWFWVPWVVRRAAEIE